MKNHIQPDQVNEETIDIPDIEKRRDTDIIICESLKIILKRRLSLKVKIKRKLKNDISKFYL